MPFFNNPSAGPGNRCPQYTILNVIRACNIICLFSVIAASFVMLIKTFVVSKFFFFDGVSHLITAFVSIGLILTEVGLFKHYIADNWPLLSLSHGFVTLGIMMLTLGVSILGNLNKEATSQKSLGTPMWRCVISSGILNSIFGIVNIFASYICRRKDIDVSARMVRKYGHQAPEKVGVYTPSISTSRKGIRPFHLRRSRTIHEEVLPSYHTRNPSNASQRAQTRNVSAPVTGSGPNGLGFYGEKSPGAMTYDPPVDGREGGVHMPPVDEAGVKQPNLAYHPAYQGRPF